MEVYGYEKGNNSHFIGIYHCGVIFMREAKSDTARGDTDAECDADRDSVIIYTYGHMHHNPDMHIHANADTADYGNNRGWRSSIKLS
jgi:hypothetical protein